MSVFKQCIFVEIEIRNVKEKLFHSEAGEKLSRSYKPEIPKSFFNVLNISDVINLLGAEYSRRFRLLGVEYFFR